MSGKAFSHLKMKQVFKHHLIDKRIRCIFAVKIALETIESYRLESVEYH